MPNKLIGAKFELPQSIKKLGIKVLLTFKGRRFSALKFFNLRLLNRKGFHYQKNLAYELHKTVNVSFFYYPRDAECCALQV